MARKLVPTPKPGIYPNVPMETYLAWDAWGASDLRAMLDGPEACWFKKYEAESESTPAADFGTLAHLALLEPERWPPKDIAWIPGPYNENPGRRDKADAQDRGFRVFKPEVRDAVNALVKRAHEHERIRKLLLLSTTEREVCAIARCPQTGILLKARCDLRAPDIATIADLKTTTAGSGPDAFQNQLWDRGYYTSAPHYCEVFSMADPKRPIDTYLYIVADQAPPHTPWLYSIDPLTFSAGSDLNDYFRRRVAECLKNPKLWRKTPTTVETVGLSSWRLERIKALLEKEAASA